MRIYLVRHGETEWNREAVFRGRIDLPLNGKGRAQAEKTGAAFHSVPIGRVVSSPLARARETAEPIGRVTGCPVMAAEEFTDMSFGVWEGLTVDEARSLLPEAYETWEKAPQKLRLQGGETLREVRGRIRKGLKSAMAATEGDLVIVSHRVVCKVLTLALLGAPDNLFWTMRCDPCSITLVEVKGNGNVFHYINDTCHLKGPDTPGVYKDF